MNRLLAAFLLSFFLVLAFPRQPGTNNRLYLEKYTATDHIYHQAEQLSSLPGYSDETGEKEAAMNLQALKGFKNILPAIEKAHDDSLAFHCYYKIGVLEHYFDSLPAAKRYYEMAVAIQSRLPSLPDSFLFKPYLFIGGIQYNNNQFDSALVNYKKAEEIAGRYTTLLEGTNRLYNTLGAMYFETGNYSQAKNYFEKAITLLGKPNSSNEGLLINYKINLAATLTRLEEFDAANNIYQELLKQDIDKNDILHNIGTIHLRSGDGRKALYFFEQVKYTNNKNVRLLNDIGQAYESMNQPDSARYYYLEAITQNQQWNNNRKNVQAGLTLQYLGDLDYRQNEFRKALDKYQQAIVQLVNDFDTTDIYGNPSQFSDVFSYINLFNLLTAKANTFEKFYQQVKDIKELEASLDTYRAAFRLADYVERTYDSDEARLFLDKIKYTAHSKPIDVSLLLYDLTQKKGFLEDAYLFDQRNKASILSLNIQENEWRNKQGAGNELFRQESSVKTAITRLSLKAGQVTDSASLAKINASIRDYEIQLGKLEDKINNDPVFGEKQLNERIPPVSDLQKQLDNHTALLSYHLSDNKLLILFITAGSFEYSTSPLAKEFIAGIDSFKTSLVTEPGDQKYNGSLVSMELYKKLILPVHPKLSGIDRLIIIPDDELNYLPFEALQDEKQQYLVQKFSVQYLYSTSLFGKNHPVHATENTLAFAPFISKNFTDSSGFTLSSLPASKDEVNNLEGKIFKDSNATKEHFLQSANHYGIIHLATHASVNNEMPLRSFISFYPGGNTSDYRLYAGEIYNMNLDSTQLIILSACETGTGRLVKGEGLMSLSRAFAYAGCPNIITSLWKAEDKTTAYISERLHHYLSKGFRKDKALQQAKLDLLNSTDMDPRFKAPNYWAHLVFIGQYEAAEPSFNGWWWIAPGTLLLAAAIIITRVKRKNRRP
ncbi:MAG: CHAT domain-containing protein [Bacteroidota bacterium]|nr:CHAT domain-containing protein [Bacteroidota bacterium]